MAKSILEKMTVLRTSQARWLIRSLALAPLAGAGSVVLLLATRWGVGVGYDSVYYLSAADNLLHGLGLSRLAGGGNVVALTHFPPLYPLVIAGLGGLLHASTSVVARGMEAGLFGGLALLSGLLVMNFTNDGLAGGATTLLVITSPVLFDVGAWAMSEGLYLVLLVGAFWLLGNSLRSRRWTAVVLAGLFSGAAYATRYVGVAVLASGVLVVWCSRSTDWRQRLMKSLLYLALGVLPVLAWMIRNLVLTGAGTNRTLIFHLVSRARLAQGAHTVAGWLVPPAFPFRLSLGLMLVLLGCLFAYWLKTWLNARITKPVGWDPPSQLAAVVILHAFLYVALLLASLSLFDASTPLDGRILSPLLVSFYLLLILALSRWRHSRSGLRWPTGVGLLGVTIILVLGGLRTWNLAQTDARTGLGFNSRAWTTSPTVAWVRQLHQGAILTSNEAFPLYYLTGRPVYGAPEATDPVKAEPRLSFKADLEAMRQRLQHPDSYLIVFHPDNLRVELPPLKVLTSGLNLTTQMPDAKIYTGR